MTGHNEDLVEQIEDEKIINKHFLAEQSPARKLLNDGERVVDRRSRVGFQQRPHSWNGCFSHLALMSVR